MTSRPRRNDRRRSHARSGRRAARALGQSFFRQVERFLDAYAVVGADDAVVTVGHRQRRDIRA
jgi:hypothetical protein